MSLVDTIKAMRSAGVDEAQILDTVLLLEQDRETREAEVLARKRAGDAERKRRSRHGASHDVTRTICDNADPLLSPPTPPTNNPLPGIPPKGEIPTHPTKIGSDQILEAFNAYNAKAEGLSLPTARALNSERKRKLAMRLREHGLDGWRTALEELAKSEFLTGQNDRGWCADLDFLLSPTKLTKMIEGGYRSIAPGHGPPLKPGTEAFDRAKSEALRRGNNDEYYRLKAMEQPAQPA